MSGLRVFCITSETGGSIVGVKTYNREFPLAWLAKVVTGLSKALTEADRLEGDLSVNPEAEGFCSDCGGAGFVVGPLEYASVESGCWCTNCEVGRRLVERIADIVTRAEAEDLPAGLPGSPLYQRRVNARRKDYAKTAS